MKKIIPAVLCALSLLCLVSCADKMNVAHDFTLGESYNKARTTLVENNVKFKEYESNFNKKLPQENIGQISSFEMFSMDKIEFDTSLQGTRCQVSLCFFEGRLAKICMECAGKDGDGEVKAALVRKEFEGMFPGKSFVSDDSDGKRVCRMKLTEQQEIELSSSHEVMSCILRDKVLCGKFLALQEQAMAGYLQVQP